jgi:hypothetical protein
VCTATRGARMPGFSLSALSLMGGAGIRNELPPGSPLVRNRLCGLYRRHRR